MKRIVGLILSLALLLAMEVPAAARPPVLCALRVTPNCGGGGSVEPPPAPPAPSDPPPGGGGGGGSSPPDPCRAPASPIRPHAVKPASDDNPGDDPPIVCVNGTKVAVITQRTDAGVFVKLNSSLLLRLGAKVIKNDESYIWVASPTHLLGLQQDGIVWDGEWFNGPDYSLRGDYVPLAPLGLFLGGRVQDDDNRILVKVTRLQPSRALPHMEKADHLLHLRSRS